MKGTTMNSLKPFAAVYEGLWKHGYLAEGEALQTLEDMQEGRVKDGLGADPSLASFISAIKAASATFTNEQVRVMLNRASRG